MVKASGFRDSRGVIYWTSPKLMDFDYKYLTIGTIKPKGVRGGHYHKKIVEKFLCVEGSILAVLDKDTIEMESGDIVDIPAGCNHLFLNIGNTEAFFVEYKDREFNEDDKDTYSKA